MEKHNLRFSIAYTIHNKVGVIPLIVEGLSKIDCFEILVLFDACTDGSLDRFLELSKPLSNLRVFENKGYDLFEPRANNFLLKHSEGDVCVLFQDDMVIENDQFLHACASVISQEPNVGIIGLKDGYEMENANSFESFVSSAWSDSKDAKRRLKVDEQLFRTFVNRGPIAVPKTTVEKVGLLDERFFPLFWDDNDYCYRCREGGLKNVLLGSQFLSEQAWGTTRGTSKIPLSMAYYCNRLKFQKKHNFPGPQLRLANVHALLAFGKYHLWRAFAWVRSYLTGSVRPVSLSI